VTDPEVNERVERQGGGRVNLFGPRRGGFIERSQASHTSDVKHPRLRYTPHTFLLQNLLRERGEGEERNTSMRKDSGSPLGRVKGL